MVSPKQIHMEPSRVAAAWAAVTLSQSTHMEPGKAQTCPPHLLKTPVPRTLQDLRHSCVKVHSTGRCLATSTLTLSTQVTRRAALWR